jgi:SAM-dependent methyltransferase
MSAGTAYHDNLGDFFATNADTSPHNAYTDRPAMLALAGDVCALMLHHVTNRAQLLGELRRDLRPGGRLLVSTSHPTADWKRFGGSYHAEDWVDLSVAGGAFSIH